MKFWIKVLVAICVVVVIVFAVWAFFFREKEEVQAYNKTAELINYKQSLGIREKLIKLNATNYISNNKDSVISDDTDAKKNIHKYRQLCMSTEEITGYGTLAFPSLFTMDEYLDEVLEYYLPFTQTNSVKNSSLKRLKNDISEYVDELKELDVELSKIINYQNTITGTDAEFGYLEQYYIELYGNYRDVLNVGADVVLSLENFIDVSAYSDEVLVDVNFALFDAFARTINFATSVDEVLSGDYAHHVNIIIKAIDKQNSGNLEFGEYSEHEFLTAYNNLYNNHSENLDLVYSQNLDTKQKMAVADKNALSIVLEKIQNSVTIVLKTLGY